MKKLLFAAFALAVSVAIANDIVFFNPTSSPITNRVTGYAVSLNEPLYYGATNALIITNVAAQIGAGVMTNLAGSVVQWPNVRLMTAAELNRIAATNALIAAASVATQRSNDMAAAAQMLNATNSEGRILRAFALLTLDQINTLRQRTTLTALPVITTNVFLGAMSNMVINDPR